MQEPRNFHVERSWQILTRDLGIDPAVALARAGLPSSLIHEDHVVLTASEYFGYFEVLHELADVPALALAIGTSMRVEAFSAPIFAALCSPDLTMAVRRIATHKRLMAPVDLHLEQGSDGLTVRWDWGDPTRLPPALVVGLELVVLTQIARIATREHIEPVAVGCPVQLEPIEAYRDFFGVEPTVTPQPTITFRASDARRPFLTVNEPMWDTFEPELQRRQRDLHETQHIADRVGLALLECLPAGDASLNAAAARLVVSARTLQRQLAAEGTTFRAIVHTTRERLARHYLLTTALPLREIAFLLGYDETTSFIRAFQTWTGSTPSAFRAAESTVTSR